MKLSIPGKIFIAGEYAALRGLPALTVAVNPCFTFEPDSSLPTNAFHPQSPAGLLFENARGKFLDPFKEIGGMGRSTAEFLAAGFVSKIDLKNKWQTWERYRTILTSKFNTPSGVDLLTQLNGGYCLTETSKQSLQSTQWPFEKLDWVALITGHKKKTHEHLASELKVDWNQGQVLNQKVIDAFKAGNSEEFVEALKNWRHFLFSSELEIEETTELVEFFMNLPGVEAVKGCGALGSDVILVIFRKENSERLQRSLELWNSEHVIRSSNVCIEGLQIKGENENFSTL